jgi:hypothetical protein
MKRPVRRKISEKTTPTTTQIRFGRFWKKCCFMILRETEQKNAPSSELLG